MKIYVVIYKVELIETSGRQSSQPLKMIWFALYHGVTETYWCVASTLMLFFGVFSNKCSINLMEVTQMSNFTPVSQQTILRM